MSLGSTGGKAGGRPVAGGKAGGRPVAAARWSLAALVVVIALIVAIWPRGDAEAPGSSTVTSVEAGPSGGAGTTASDDDRSAAALAECPAPTPGASAAGPLAGLTLECLGTGAPIDLGAALAGRPTLLNLWAYWCAPCAEELPYLQQFADRAEGLVTVLTVHEDPKAANALTRLSDYGVRLPGLQDGSSRVAAAVGAPNVLPVSVLVAGDGTVAAVLPQPFDSVDDIAAAVRTHLGISA